MFVLPECPSPHSMSRRVVGVHSDLDAGVASLDPSVSLAVNTPKVTVDSSTGTDLCVMVAFYICSRCLLPISVLVSAPKINAVLSREIPFGNLRLSAMHVTKCYCCCYCTVVTKRVLAAWLQSRLTGNYWRVKLVLCGFCYLLIYKRKCQFWTLSNIGDHRNHWWGVGWQILSVCLCFP